AEDGIRDYKVTGVQTCALPSADHGRVSAVLGPRPRGDVRPRSRGQAGLSSLLPVALRAAEAGAAVLIERGLPRPGSAFELKGAGDYVTATDRRSEAAILEVLTREAPGVAVLAEEGGGLRASTMWTVDPLDGTTNFTRGFPTVAVSVALLDSGLPAVGVVLAPFLGLEFVAARALSSMAIVCRSIGRSTRRARW